MRDTPPPDPFSGDLPDPTDPRSGGSSQFGPAGSADDDVTEPLSPAEREDVLADLEDLEVFRTLRGSSSVRNTSRSSRSASTSSRSAGDNGSVTSSSAEPAGPNCDEPPDRGSVGSGRSPENGSGGGVSRMGSPQPGGAAAADGYAHSSPRDRTTGNG